MLTIKFRKRFSKLMMQIATVLDGKGVSLVRLLFINRLYEAESNIFVYLMRLCIRC